MDHLPHAEIKLRDRYGHQRRLVAGYFCRSLNTRAHGMAAQQFRP